VPPYQFPLSISEKEALLQKPNSKQKLNPGKRKQVYKLGAFGRRTLATFPLPVRNILVKENRMGLLNSTVLDWAIGIVFAYLLLAIICTTVNEWIAGILSLRAKTLAKGIGQLLDNQKGNDNTVSFLQEFYAHPLISAMLAPGKTAAGGHPAYLPSRTFATTVMDLATSGKLGSITFADLEQGTKSLPEGDVKTALLALLQNASGDLDRAQKNIEEWFDDTMERASGWYKRQTQVFIVCIAAVLTIATNADTIRIGHLLWTNGTLRATIVEKAKNRAETGKEAANRTESVGYPDKDNPRNPQFKPSQDDLKALKPLLGWTAEDKDGWRDRTQWPSRLLGWMLSIIAISLGAPFWFDMLNKLMNIRNAGQKPKQSDDQSNGGPSPGAGAGKASTPQP
jgi:hypothetical protein